MKLISHRGNINGPDLEKENTIEQIFIAIGKGFDVEVDVACRRAGGRCCRW